ncbi:uncharacterized protein LOC108682931 isoform X1 [Hyalella azteca]|uniref:Uncharacterized protein LOC108682931 isoform X1 n=1 Tax=Hyalella azteca TaxID=294128 RepID=A0A8B7PQD0_HYAAZ|nr:uncharacterized protein LOC108682931 isoform X1 [Hyalella azteca]
MPNAFIKMGEGTGPYFANTEMELPYSPSLRSGIPHPVEAIASYPSYPSSAPYSFPGSAGVPYTLSSSCAVFSSNQAVWGAAPSGIVTAVNSTVAFSPSATLSPNVSLLSPRSPYGVNMSPKTPNLAPSNVAHNAYGTPNANVTPNAYVSPNANVATYVSPNENMAPNSYWTPNANMAPNAMAPNANANVAPRAVHPLPTGAMVSPGLRGACSPNDSVFSPGIPSSGNHPYLGQIPSSGNHPYLGQAQAASVLVSPSGVGVTSGEGVPVAVSPGRGYKQYSMDRVDCVHQFPPPMSSPGNFDEYSIPCSQCENPYHDGPARILYRVNPEGLASSANRATSKLALRRSDSLNGELGCGSVSRVKPSGPSASEMLYGNAKVAMDPRCSLWSKSGTPRPIFNSNNRGSKDSDVFHEALSPNIEKKKMKQRLRISSDSAIGREEFDFEQPLYFDGHKCDNNCSQCLRNERHNIHDTLLANKYPKDADLNRRHSEFLQKVERLQELSKTLINDAQSGISGRGRNLGFMELNSNETKEMPTKVSPMISPKFITTSPRSPRNINLEFNSAQKSLGDKSCNRFPVDNTKFPELGDTPDLKRPRRSGKDRVRFMDVSNNEAGVGELSPRTPTLLRSTQKLSPKLPPKFGQDLKEIHV